MAGVLAGIGFIELDHSGLIQQSLRDSPLALQRRCLESGQPGLADPTTNGMDRLLPQRVLIYQHTGALHVFGKPGSNA